MNSPLLQSGPHAEAPGPRAVDTSGPRRLAAGLVVWGLWGLPTAFALAFVGVYGVNVPYWDDWDMVPVRTGRQPLTLDWLWAQHNEHRIPLPKLLYVALARGCGDLRAGMVFNVLCLAAVAAGLILAVRRR